MLREGWGGRRGMSGDVGSTPLLPLGGPPPPPSPHTRVTVAAVQGVLYAVVKVLVPGGVLRHHLIGTTLSCPDVGQ